MGGAFFEQLQHAVMDANVGPIRSVVDKTIRTELIANPCQLEKTQGPVVRLAVIHPVCSDLLGKERVLCRGSRGLGRVFGKQLAAQRYRYGADCKYQ